MTLKKHFFLIIFFNVVSIKAQDYLSALPLELKPIIVNFILKDSQEVALSAITNLSMVNKEWHAVCGKDEFQETRKNLIKELRDNEARRKEVDDKFLKNVHIRPSCKDTVVDFFSSVFFCSPGFCCNKKIKNDYCAHVKKKYGLNVNHESLKTDKYLKNDFEAYESERQCTSLYVPWFALACCMCHCLKYWCSPSHATYSRGSGFVG